MVILDVDTAVGVILGIFWVIYVFGFMFYWAVWNLAKSSVCLVKKVVGGDKT